MDRKGSPLAQHRHLRTLMHNNFVVTEIRYPLHQMQRQDRRALHYTCVPEDTSSRADLLRSRTRTRVPFSLHGCG